MVKIDGTLLKLLADIDRGKGEIATIVNPVLLLRRQPCTGRFIVTVGRLAVERRGAAFQFGRERFNMPRDFGGGIAREE